MLICYYVFIYYSVFFLVILSTNHLFLVKMRNFPKKYLVVRKLYVYPSGQSNFATLNLKAAVMQLRRLRV